MNNPVIISEEMFDPDTLDDLIKGIETVTRAPVKREHQLVLTSESASAMLALDALFGNPQLLPERKVKGWKGGKGKLPALFTKSTPPQPAPASSQDTPAHEIKVWQVHAPGKAVDAITLAEKNRRLVTGEFETGTLLKHPRAGWQKVTGEQGTPQGMEPCDTPDS